MLLSGQLHLLQIPLGHGFPPTRGRKPIASDNSTRQFGHRQPTGACDDGTRIASTRGVRRLASPIHEGAGTRGHERWSMKRHLLVLCVLALAVAALAPAVASAWAPAGQATVHPG